MKCWPLRSPQKKQLFASGHRWRSAPFYQKRGEGCQCIFLKNFFDHAAAEEAKYLSELAETIAKNNIAKPEQEARQLIKYGKDLEARKNQEILAEKLGLRIDPRSTPTGHLFLDDRQAQHPTTPGPVVRVATRMAILE